MGHCDVDAESLRYAVLALLSPRLALVTMLVVTLLRPC